MKPRWTSGCQSVSLDDVGYEADIDALRREYPELSTFERYLRSHGWEGAKLPVGG
jgi:hypothetical protein